MCQTSYFTFQSLSKDTTCVKLHTLPFSPSPHFLGTGRAVIQWLEQLGAVKVHLVCVPERFKGVALLGIAPTRFTGAASSSVAEG